MRMRTATLITLGAIAVPAAGVAIATEPSGLKTELLARGAAGEFRVQDETTDLELAARRATDVAVVRATLDPDGSTGWHGHPGPSIVVVKTGTVTMLEADGDDPHGDHRHGDRDDAQERGDHRRCSTKVFGPGSAFVHPEHVHNFVNRTDAVTEFYVVYLVPAGAAPLLNDATAPARCP